MKSETKKVSDSSHFEKNMGIGIDPATKKILEQSEEAKNLYLDYLIFSQS